MTTAADLVDKPEGVLVVKDETDELHPDEQAVLEQGAGADDETDTGEGDDTDADDGG